MIKANENQRLYEASYNFGQLGICFSLIAGDTAFVAISDLRGKENIEDINYGLKPLLQLSPLRIGAVVSINEIRF